MKDLPLSILVYHGIHSGIFSDYDWAPSLVEFHGVKMYGKVSQEAHADLKKLQSERFIEKLHLSTRLYDWIRAYRATPKSDTALAALPDVCRQALVALLNCSHSGALQEILAYVERANGHWGQVRNSTVTYCPGGAASSEPIHERAHHRFRHRTAAVAHHRLLRDEFPSVRAHGRNGHPYNMPELYTPLGYIGVITVMALMAVVQVLYFSRKGLLGSGDR